MTSEFNPSDLVAIDGAAGEGGGQIVRSTLALSAATRMPVRIFGIRAGRKRPGLMRQHLTAVRAAAAVCRGRVTGDAIGAQEIALYPGTPTAGHYRFAIGTAGSTSLVLQTVLPILLRLDTASTVRVEGSTHNSMAPSFDFIARTYAPALRLMGFEVEAELERYGFYPAGGGAGAARIGPPGTLRPLALTQRGPIEYRRAEVIAAQLPRHVAEREVAALVTGLHWPRDDVHIVPGVRSPGPGNAIMVEVGDAAHREMFTAFGARGVRAESVAADAVKQVHRYLTHDAPVGPHLADQLLLPMVLGPGGEFRTGPLTRHTQTHIDLIERFLPGRVTTEIADDRTVTVAVTASHDLR